MITHTHSNVFLTAPSHLNLALVLLNIDGACDLSHPVLRHLWPNAAVRMCADGAANRLHDAAPGESVLPDCIRGDLDSLRNDVADFYRERGVVVEHDASQVTNDFEKCLVWLQQRLPAGERPYSVVAYGAFGGRLDQTFANLNLAYK